MPLLPGWPERLAEVQEATETPPAPLVLPRSPEFFAGQTVYVSTVEEAREMAELAAQRPLAWVGFDFEFQYDRPGVVIDKRHTAHDPRSIRPLLLSLSLAEPSDVGVRLYGFVIDVRRPEVLPAVASVLRLPICFVAHYAQAELFCLLQ